MCTMNSEWKQWMKRGVYQCTLPFPYCVHYEQLMDKGVNQCTSRVVYRYTTLWANEGEWAIIQWKYRHIIYVHKHHISGFKGTLHIWIYGGLVIIPAAYSRNHYGIENRYGKFINMSIIYSVEWAKCISIEEWNKWWETNYVPTWGTSFSNTAGGPTWKSEGK